MKSSEEGTLFLMLETILHLYIPYSMESIRLVKIHGF